MTGLKGLLGPLELAFWARVSLLGVMGRSPLRGMGWAVQSGKRRQEWPQRVGGTGTGDSLVYSFPTH